MALHLFATPVQCTQCGTTVEDPTRDRCPNCGALLKERRAPRRLAGVEERYRSLRVLLAAIRFLAVMVLIVSGLVFFGSIDQPDVSGTEAALMLLGGLLGSVGMFALAGFFELMMDVEENTRSSFRLQQMVLEGLQETARGAAAAAAAEGGAGDVTVTRPVDAASAPRAGTTTTTTVGGTTAAASAASADGR